VSARVEPADGDEVLPFLHVDRVVRAGTVIVMLFFFGFIGWAALAPLESAVISLGVVVSPRKPDEVGVAARVRPQDIEELRPGGTAKVEFGAYKARRMPMLTGTVTYISPDALVDARTGEPYFLVRISIDHTALKEYRETRFIPGVPVQVEIPTGSHTALEYFVGPIRDVMHNGMREK
jgi:multidrug efflux pump subunit AcrA (membrane-fusion protein)